MNLSKAAKRIGIFDKQLDFIFHGEMKGGEFHEIEVMLFFFNFIELLKLLK